MFLGRSNVICKVLKRWTREAEELEPEREQWEQNQPDFADSDGRRGQGPRNEGSLWNMEKAKQHMIMSLL